ncbi:MAG: ZPR1 zinc finger domain-containing protein [Candidatus Thermoplasmatota archaeon]|nr:ZPR1 zinc finger domain-containing protein [Candidatus Thermoplasmatota archaeon]
MDATPVVKCPVCSEGELYILTDQLTIPYFGDIVVSTISCPKCGFRSSDVIPLETRTPKRYSVIINSPGLMNLRVVRSGTSIVRIPEILARIDPGDFSEGYVTNVEGILRRFRDILFQLIMDMDQEPASSDVNEKKARASELARSLGYFIDGPIPPGEQITLIIEDPMGNSAIISPEDGIVSEEVLSAREIEELLSPRSGKNTVNGP